MVDLLDLELESPIKKERIVRRVNRNCSVAAAEHFCVKCQKRGMVRFHVLDGPVKDQDHFFGICNSSPKLLNWRVCLPTSANEIRLELEWNV